MERPDLIGMALARRAGHRGRETMIDCVPRGICSWGFILSGNGHRGETVLNGFGEEGSLSADGHFYQVSKGGWLSGEWTLLEGGHPVVLAQKAGAFSRRFQLMGPAGPVVLEAASIFGRAMQLRGAGADCRIVPAHAFTRRASIEGSFEDFRVVAFAFWLSVLMWRRASRDNSQAGT